MKHITTICLTVITITEIFISHKPPYVSMVLWLSFGVYRWDLSE